MKAGSYLFGGLVVVVIGVCGTLAIQRVYAASPDRAAVFYGSMTAALVTAIAVVGNARLERLKHDRHRTEDRALANRRDALNLIGQIEMVRQHFWLYVIYLESCEFEVQPGAQPGPDDLSLYYNTRSIRNLIEPLNTFELKETFALAASLPGDLAVSVTKELSGV